MNDHPLTEVDLWGEPIAPPSRGAIADEFLIPPFTVLNAREGWWQDRKRQWIGLGIKSELGRGDCTPGGGAEGSARNGPVPQYAKTFAIGSKAAWDAERKAKALKSCRPHLGRHPRPGRDPKEEYTGGDAWTASGSDTGTSIFDPVICELAYRWFCPAGGYVLDPFAGGSVRGIVAALLGRKYVGVELRPEQIASNTAQSDAICNGIKPQWVEGDARDIAKLTPRKADFVLSCPPYGDLERYSDDKRDLSTMYHGEFLMAYRAIIAETVKQLAENRFACFVVGDFRDANGIYRNFVSNTIDAFQKAGAMLYNEAILVTAVGSLPVRIGNQFTSSRKLGKTHQNVLVFIKGNPQVAADVISA